MKRKYKPCLKRSCPSYTTEVFVHCGRFINPANCSRNKKKIVVSCNKQVVKESNVLESRDPCDYCTDRQHPNCQHNRTEYFPCCFNGRKLYTT